MSELEKKEKIDKLCANFLVNLRKLGVTRQEIIKILKNYQFEE